MRNYLGSCHCSNIQFEAKIDLAAGTSKCNCSICRKSRFWKAVIPASDFRLRQGAEALAEYNFGNNAIHHHFCKQCGIKVYGQTHIEEMGGDIVAVNVACLDDASDAELAVAPVEYQNGREDDWDNAPNTVQHL